MYVSGKLGIIVGCGDNHATGTYHIFTLKSEHIKLTCDDKWLNIFYGDWLDMHSKTKMNYPTIHYDHDSISNKYD